MSFWKNFYRAFQNDFNEKKYWKRRLYIQKRGGAISRMLMLLVRRTEAKKLSNTGTGLIGNCCIIESPIYLPHGLNGIIIARNVRIGKNVAIYQHVTIAESDPLKMTIIEDDVMIGAGAVIMNNVVIGKGAKIGANAVVLCDVPSGATAVGVPARIINNVHKQENCNNTFCLQKR